MKYQNKKICVVGLGYIGLPSAALLANRGYRIHGVDTTQKVVDTINRGEIHIVEPELDTFVRAAVGSGMLKADTKPAEADIFIIAVPTPFKNGYTPNIDFVLTAAESIAPYIRPGNLVILESTSPVGTTEKVAQVLEEHGVELSKIFVAHCPERVLPGHIMKELVGNDRIVGGLTVKSTNRAKAFYSSFVQGEVLCTDARIAEMAKLTENAFRDANIAFANELSMICDRIGIDVWELIRLANRHPRVNILRPGAGVGGHCIAVDPWFIVHSAREESKMIRTAREINTYKTLWVIEKIKNTALEFERLQRKKARIACLGLAFKPDIDDLRESPAVLVAETLQGDGFDIVVVEPNISAHDQFEIHTLENLEKTVDIAVFLVAHKEFKGLDTGDLIRLDFCGVDQI